MNAGTKYLFDSLMGLMMEVANLRNINEQQAARIAELEKNHGEKDTAQEVHQQFMGAEIPPPPAEPV